MRFVVRVFPISPDQACDPQRRQQQGDRPERSERRERPRRDEDAYDLPPVEQSTTSLAGLFAAAMANAEKKDEE